jgi:hypothetical protein
VINSITLIILPRYKWENWIKPLHLLSSPTPPHYFLNPHSFPINSINNHTTKEKKEISSFLLPFSPPRLFVSLPSTTPLSQTSTLSYYHKFNMQSSSWTYVMLRIIGTSFNFISNLNFSQFLHSKTMLV